MATTIRSLIRLLVLSAIFLSPISLSAQEWQNLTKDLSLWQQMGGKATFRLDGAEIIGTSVADTPNSWLTTKALYGDFILEYEAKTDNLLNSGVIIRGLSDPSYRGGVVHGYQVELDHSERLWSGGIYDEQRREWLAPLSRNEAARKAFKRGEWNHFRIEAIGSRIRTFVNGVPAAHLIDDMTASGFIALQVHSVAKPEEVGREARFRKIRIVTKNPSSYATKADPNEEEFNFVANSLTAAEKAKGWTMLFDGQSTKMWKSTKGDSFPTKGWSVTEGELRFAKSEGGTVEGEINGGDIVTREKFKNFILELDFKLSAGANSGIKYLGGLEFQLLDDKLHPDAKQGVKGNRTVGALYDLIPAHNLSEATRASKRVMAPGQWNRARIVVKGNHVEHWLNNVKVVEYERKTPMFRALIAYSKYRDNGNFGEVDEGAILLQDHGDAVAFRSIKILRLP